MSGALKVIVRNGFRGLVGLTTMATLPLRARDRKIAVYYGGARGGDLGGTLVKVRLLQSRFPEHRIGYSLLYMLSNAIYLPAAVIEQVRAAGVPLVLNQNGVFYPGWYPDGWQRENARMATVHSAADHVFYQSEFCRFCAEKFLGRRSGLSEILFNGVDTDHFVPANNEPKPGPFTFLATGKFGASTAYRLSSSIAGLAAARAGGLDVRLTIAGPIEPAVEVKARVLTEALGLNEFVAFLGPYTGAQAPAIYQAADAYLMTKHNDPCPNAVLEALACGLPILYSASGGVPEQVGPDAGFGLPVPFTFETDVAPEPNAIAAGMVHVIRQRDTMATAARARAVERFDLSLWFARHETIFRSLVEKVA
ncbi:MAG: glycosyltransferase family 4 protein [Pseudolabrys sp.]|nr:glycosyltransferase family 4 protein [Pseudolabrys sp.]